MGQDALCKSPIWPNPTCLHPYLEPELNLLYSRSQAQESQEDNKESFKLLPSEDDEAWPEIGSQYWHHEICQSV